MNSVIYLQVKETSRLHGISTKGELSQLAVLLHELVLQVTWKKHAGSIIPKNRSSSPHHTAILRYFRRSSGCSPRKQSLSCELHPAAPRRLCSWTSPTLRRCPGITSPAWRRERCFFCKHRLLKFSTRKSCQAQSQEEERRIPSPDSTQCHVAVDATKNTRRMESAGNKEMMESCSRTNHGLIDSGRRANSNQEVVESRQTLTSCPTSSYNWHQPDFSA